jgi:hypothetical protein
MSRTPPDPRFGCAPTRPFAIAVLLAFVLLSACTQGARWDALMTEGETALERGDLMGAEQRFAAAMRQAEHFEPADPRRAITREIVTELDTALIQRVGPAPKPLEVAAAGSPAAPTPGAEPSPTPQGAGFAVHLASYRTLNKANRGWRHLQQAFPDLLGRTTMTLEQADLGELGVFQRILSGPFAERAAAERVCAALKAKDQFCRILRREGIAATTALGQPLNSGTQY